MDKFLLLFCCLFFGSLQSIGQNRTIDGTDNNLNHAEWGSRGEQLRTITSNGFDDEISEPGGANRPNPRVISNTLFAQDSLINDLLELSDYTWVFGQFIDHDVIATPSDPTEDASIDVNFPDIHFNPGGAFPFIQIHMFRSLEHPGTGTSTSNPRGYTNDITSWIDGSAVYGSDTDRANYLRTFQGGKLKTSTGNLLPWNTDTHELDGTIDASAPFMDNENPFNDLLFVAGDARANENVALAAFHTIFVREHNRLCDELTILHPDWTDEELYQHARKMIGGFIQSIVYNEWLPAMGVHLPDYSGYDDSLHPTITNVFSAAAFRLGHTLLSGTVPRLDNQGNEIPEGSLTLLEAFFAPLELEEAGIDPIFKGLAGQIQQQLDCKVVDDVRNFLFGPPQSGLGGLDLASININRGRERGLPDFNTIRTDLGLAPFATFLELNSDPDVAMAMEDLYGDINNIDPWVGMLAEEHMDDALFGTTIMKIMEEQFLVLREGDRFYFENDPVLSQAEKDEIQETTFRDIIMRNTGITVMQMNVFDAMPHDSICPAEGPIANIEGVFQTFDSDLVEGIDVQINYLENGDEVGAATTDGDGAFEVVDLSTCAHYDIAAEKLSSYDNGVSTFDLIFIRRHILGADLLDNPYKVLSADANDDKNISSLDMIAIRKIILAIQDTFDTNASWRFVDQNIDFDDPNDPFDATLDQATINYLAGDTSVNFIALKIGDVSGDADPSGFTTDSDVRTYPESIILEAKDEELEPGVVYNVSFDYADLERLAGMQFALNINPDAFELEGVIGGQGTNIVESNYTYDQKTGKLLFSWDAQESVQNETLLTLSLKSKTTGFLSDYIEMNPEILKGEAYTESLETYGVELLFERDNTEEIIDLKLYQNNPNPFNENTAVSFNLPSTDEVTITIYDMSGKMIFQHSAIYNTGFNVFEIEKSKLNTFGILHCQLNSSFGSQTIKMVRVN